MVPDAGEVVTLDDDLLHALGYGSPWEQLALRLPPYVVAKRLEPIASPLTASQRREVTKWHRAGHAPAIIARRLGVTIPAVRAWIAARGTRSHARGDVRAA